MKEINCNIIRDLLPLYEDGAVSEDTAQLVREHLESCPACREEYERMHTPTPVPPDRDISMIQHMEREINKKSVLRFFCVLGVLAVLACLFCLWYTWPVPYDDLLPEGAECQEITFSAYVYREGERIWSQRYEKVTLTPEDPAFSQLLALVDEKSYRRTNIFPRGFGADNSEPGTFQWHLTLHYDVPQEDGTVSRETLWLEHFYTGLMSISLYDASNNEIFFWNISVDGRAEWADDVMDVIRQFPDALVPLSFT